MGATRCTVLPRRAAGVVVPLCPLQVKVSYRGVLRSLRPICPHPQCVLAVGSSSRVHPELPPVSSEWQDVGGQCRRSSRAQGKALLGEDRSTFLGGRCCSCLCYPSSGRKSSLQLLGPLMSPFTSTALAKEPAKYSTF